ncbi:hypothetical protein UFOVP109_22 [uncultured Caudovirales phage]|uniref:Uncharacterized protein n=1 Tax=uncultured Caudovirales phage TaxID=2100421 RepID=A0A6J5L459_9CAUD|nr:hypothetical protein UFOVP109_22 [uncultured Caudovirales phage]CAB5218857.1 hypothetical protein UFOVP224_2 [uncultured Caudovirales phage]
MKLKQAIESAQAELIRLSRQQLQTYHHRQGAWHLTDNPKLEQRIRLKSRQLARLRDQLND